MKDCFYFSLDVETDGQSPGLGSILQLGCAAFVPESTAPIGSWQMNFFPLPGVDPDRDTILWWRTKHPETWLQLACNREEPCIAMFKFAEWVKDLCEKTDRKPVAMAWPASWDWGWIYYYFNRFRVASPFGHTALDIKSLWFAYTLRKDQRSWASGRTYKSDVPEEWRDGVKHTHEALVDAVEQGKIFIHLLRELIHEPVSR